MLDRLCYPPILQWLNTRLNIHHNSDNDNPLNASHIARFYACSHGFQANQHDAAGAGDLRILSSSLDPQIHLLARRALLRKIQPSYYRRCRKLLLLPYPGTDIRVLRECGTFDHRIGAVRDEETRGIFDVKNGLDAHGIIRVLLAQGRIGVVSRCRATSRLPYHVVMSGKISVAKNLKFARYRKMRPVTKTSIDCLSAVLA